MKYIFTVEIDTDNVIGVKEEIASALENVGKVGFPDVNAIVRCKECTYSSNDGCICHYGVGRDVKPNHYCGYGERMCVE